MAAGPASTAAQPSDPTTVQNRQDQKEAFLKAGSTETRNSGNLALPASPYQVMAGTVIAGALVTGMKSDLPGDVIATVTEPVYDTATGKFLLIPQGSRILGRYNSQVSYGHPSGYAVMQALIAQGVIGDFRAPDLMRFGFTPLYVRFQDIWDAVAILRQVLSSGEWRNPAFNQRAAVT